MKDEIKFSDFEKLDLRVAKILNVEDIDNADKLYKLILDLGNEKRIVCAGIKQHYSKKELIGKEVVLLANLKPRLLKGIESQGMILAASDEDHNKIVLLTTEEEIEEGWQVS